MKFGYRGTPQNLFQFLPLLVRQYYSDTQMLLVVVGVDVRQCDVQTIVRLYLYIERASHRLLPLLTAGAKANETSHIL